MPDRVVKQVIALGQRCKQQRVSERLQFLNRIKEKFSWGDGTEDEDESQELVETHETDHLAAEIPRVELEEDSEIIQAVQDSPSGPNQLEQAAMALSNANLRHTVTPDDEIAGVFDDENLDDPPPLVSDDDDSSDEESDDEQEDEEQFDEDEEQFDFGEEGDDGELGSEVGNDEDAAESEADQPDGTQMPLRRSERIKKKKEPLIIDFKNRTYQEKDGVIHINPSVEEWAREGTKISRDVLPKPETTNGRIAVRSPKTAGISREALARVSLGALGLPPPTTTRDETVVEDHVVMHILGVVLAEQYTINKGFRLFGERAKDSVRKELKLGGTMPNRPKIKIVRLP
jgi:hypothetical protein